MMTHPDSPRVLHVIDQTVIGGAQVLLCQMACGLRQRFPSAVAVLGEEGRYSQEYRDAGFSVIGLSGGAGRWSFRQLPSLISLIRAGRFAIVHTHLLKSAILGVVAARFSGTRVIIHDHMGIYPASMTRAHYLPFPPLRAAYLSAYRAVLRACDRVIVLTPEIQAAYQRLYPADASKVRQIPNAVDVGRFSSQSPEASADLRIRLGISADTAVMMMVGRLEPEKDWWTFLRVAEIVGRRAPGPCAFLAVGWGGEEAALLRYTRERGLTQVHFLGYRDDIPALLAASDMFLLTSRMEPFGIALIEAMAAGVPVLATRSGGPESIITDGDDGVLVPVGDDETMAARVLDLLADPERRAWIGRRGRATVNHRYSMPIMLDRLARLYADLVGHTPG